MAGADSWHLYDNLIELIPSDLTVSSVVDERVCLVKNSAGGTGIASRDTGGRHFNHPYELTPGASLRDAATLVKSWDFRLASLGVAAINSHFNSEQQIASIEARSAISVDRDGDSIFELAAKTVQGKKVAMIGHFSKGVALLREQCELTVIERDPEDCDLPDTSCEYVLPNSDVVLITGMTVANKTLPRLLQLSSGSEVYLVGPSVPLVPDLFRGSVRHIGGSFVKDGELASVLTFNGASTPQMKPALGRIALTF